MINEETISLDRWDDDLRVLTMIQPSCSVIRDAGKRIENRPKAYKKALRVGRGGRWFVFRAGQKRDSAQKLQASGWDQKWPDMPPRKEWPKQQALLLAHVGNVVPIDDPLVASNKWASGPWCWLLDRVIPLDPIDCVDDGGLGSACSVALFGAGHTRAIANPWLDFVVCGGGIQTSRGIGNFEPCQEALRLIILSLRY